MQFLLNSPAMMLVLASAFWGGNAVVGKFALNYMSGIELSFWRWVLAFLIVMPFTLRAVKKDLDYYRKNIGYIIVLSLLSVSVYNTFQYLALQWTGAINVGVVAASLPIMVFAMTWIAGQEKACGTQKTGLVIAFLGVLFMVSRGEWQNLVGLSFNPGDLLMIVAVAGWGTYSVLYKKVPASTDRLGLLLVQISIGLMGILPFYLWDTAGREGVSLNLPVAVILLYVAIFPSLLAFYFWNRAVFLGGANQAAMFVNLIPVFASAFAILFLSELLSTYHLVGMVAIFIGIVLSVYGRKVRT